MANCVIDKAFINYFRNKKVDVLTNLPYFDN